MSKASRKPADYFSPGSRVRRIIFYLAIILLLIFVGKAAYSFGYDVFSQQAQSEEPGEEVTVVIKEGSSVLQMGSALQKKGLIRNQYAFFVQEKISSYKGKLQAGTYILNTSYSPEYIMSVLAGEVEDDSKEAASGG
ncbi:MAG: endolytic transglycosylase MltG [Lachnospiraceae bacterium]